MNENEYATEVIKCLLGGWHPEKVRVFAEVPRGAYNNHMDALFIFDKDKEALAVEFKMNNLKSFIHQLATKSVIQTVGITPMRVIPDKEGGYKWGIRPVTIFGIKDFADKELEKVIKDLGKISWQSIYSSKQCMMYWFAYMNMPSDFDLVGSKSCRRESFFTVYKRALGNLFKYSGKILPFEVVYGLFGAYSEPVARKYYNISKKEFEDGKD